MSNDNPAEDTADQPSYEKQIEELLEEANKFNTPAGSLFSIFLRELATLKAYHRTLRYEVASLRVTLEERELEEVLDEVNEMIHEKHQQARLDQLKRLKDLSERYERERGRLGGIAWERTSGRPAIWSSMDDISNLFD